MSYFLNPNCPDQIIIQVVPFFGDVYDYSDHETLEQAWENEARYEEFVEISMQDNGETIEEVKAGFLRQVSVYKKEELVELVEKGGCDFLVNLGYVLEQEEEEPA